MHNSVVESIAKVYAKKGFTTLRFNFRGVGNSSGVHDGGAGEKEDVLGAVNFLLASGMDAIHLAGYSFGAWVNAGLDNLPEEVKAMVAVSPPVAFLDYSEISAMPLLKYVVSGKNDEFAPPALVEKHLSSWNPESQFDFIDDCNHFYSGCFPRMEELLEAFLMAEK